MLIIQELFELISLLSNSQEKDFYDFHLSENSLTFKSYTPIEDPEEFDNTISNWMDHSEHPELLYNFVCLREVSEEGVSFKFKW